MFINIDVLHFTQECYTQLPDGIILQTVIDFRGVRYSLSAYMRSWVKCGLRNAENCRRVKCGIQVRKNSCGTTGSGRVRVRNHSTSVFRILPVGNFPHITRGPDRLASANTSKTTLGQNLAKTSASIGVTLRYEAECYSVID